MDKKLIINLPFQCRANGENNYGERVDVTGVCMLEVDLGSMGIPLPSVQISVDAAWRLDDGQHEAIYEAVNNALIETFVRQAIMARLISMPVSVPKPKS